MSDAFAAARGSTSLVGERVPVFGTLDNARTMLRERFGYPDFRPSQIRAIQSVVSGRDTLIVLPTGGGKSLCYQVPALLRDGMTVVISPLISLMKDQVDALVRRGLPATFLNSTLSSAEIANRMSGVLDGTVKLLYLAPERMDGGSTLRKLASRGVTLLAVDEAHCISEWGHDFRPSYRRLGWIRENLGSPQAVALTATATPHVRADIVQQLSLRAADVIVGGFDRTNLTYHVQPTRTGRDKDHLALQWLREAPGPAIVYAPTRNSVERVTSVLVRGRIRAVAYHAGLDETLRQNAQDAFMTERARVIVATSAFGMGIDKADVRLVVHHAMPGSIEAYYQEAGRAGRDAQRSVCVLLHSPADRRTHEFFIGNAHPDRAFVEHTWRVLRKARNRERFVDLSLDEIVARLPSTVGIRNAGAALRVLAAAGALSVEPPAPDRVWVRLLATPARIAAELCDDRASDREVLRALWRSTGRRIEAGAMVDLDGLPPEFGGARGLVPVLERLEAGQFLTYARTGTGFRLHPRAADGHWSPVDWQADERRRLADLNRLDAMERYARTRACRRAFVLRYFDDPEARAQCDACDRCLSTTVSNPSRAPAPRDVKRSRLRRT
jgi:ATP-dependent DNA helicase RecQ